MLKKVLPTAMALVLASGVCAAQTEQSKKGFFLGGGINTIDSDSGSADPDNFFVQAGYGFSENLSFELQYSDSYKDGSLKDEGINVDVSMKTTSAFLAYRSAGTFFWKAKAGFMDAEATASASFEGESFSGSASESGWAAGAGVGYSFGSSAIELEYLTTDDKVGIDSIALGYNYWF